MMLVPHLYVRQNVTFLGAAGGLLRAWVQLLLSDDAQVGAGRRCTYWHTVSVVWELGRVFQSRADAVFQSRADAGNMPRAWVQLLLSDDAQVGGCLWG